MNKFLLFSIIFLFAWQNSYPTGFKINGTIRGISGGKIYLQEFYGDQSKIIDSIKTDYSGQFSFDLSAQKAPGQLRLIFSDRRFLDFLFNKENITFITSLDHLIDDMTITESLENQVYYQYLKFRVKSQKRIAELRKQLYTYDSTSAFFRELNAEYRHIIRQEEEYIQQILTSHPGLLATAFIKTDREPVPDITWNQEKANRWVFDHYPFHFMFSDTTLLRSNAVSAKIISYLSVALSIHQHPDSLEHIFRTASFRLLASTGNDSTMFHFMRAYLYNGFTKLGYPSLSALINKIPYPCCPCDTLKTLKDSDKNQPGRMPPFLSAENRSGKKIKLSLLNKPVRLFMAVADCRWSDLMLEILLKQEKISEAGVTETLFILKKDEKIPDSTDPSVFYFISDKDFQRILQISGKNQPPLLLTTDEEGKVTATYSSWLQMIQAGSF